MNKGADNLSEQAHGHEQKATENTVGFRRCHLSEPIYIDYISSGFEEILGYSLEDMHELFNDKSVHYVHPDDAEEYQSLLNKFAETEMTATFHYRVICKNGEVKIISDSMKSTLIDGVMWAFSTIVDSSQSESQIYYTPTYDEAGDNLVGALSFDMDTRQRICTKGDRMPIALSPTITLAEARDLIRGRIHPDDLERFERFVGMWHLRDVLNTECRIIPFGGERRGTYRWVRVSTTCMLNSLNRRMLHVSMVDINEEKMSEMLETKRVGLDWLTGLNTMPMFHAECLKRGLREITTDEAQMLGSHKFETVYSRDTVLPRVDVKAHQSKQVPEQTPCIMTAISISINPTNCPEKPPVGYWNQLKNAASALRIVTRDDSVLARVDNGVFLVFSVGVEDRDEFISRAGIFKAATAMAFGGKDVGRVNVGMAMGRLGDTFDTVAGNAFESLEKAFVLKGDSIVFRELDGVDYLLGGGKTLKELKMEAEEHELPVVQESIVNGNAIGFGFPLQINDEQAGKAAAAMLGGDTIAADFAHPVADDASRDVSSGKLPDGSGVSDGVGVVLANQAGEVAKASGTAAHIGTAAGVGETAELGESATVEASSEGAASAETDETAAGSVPHVRIRTFGYFEVFVDGHAIMFSNAKAKELLALLVDHRGGYISPSFAISRLWENENDNQTTRARYRKTALRLRRTLEENGIIYILDEKNGRRRIDPSKVDCDLFKHRRDDCPADECFRGIYLPDYSWGELTLAQLLYETAN